MTDRELTHNPKLLDMRARRARSQPIVRGDVVHLVPTRGAEYDGLVVDVVHHPLYGLWYDVLARGRVCQFEAERVSRLG